ncbi:general stress protein 13 [Virgibacillus sp. MSJ-26]|uniref:S1 domain-containing post-transcriptional regulator GSP13 n=1 Tax=Virgibacillus sp. MSJ-26 TaxID=2841522 RepID=UPI001C11F274|nr:S1 domain-containing post-transcriptional regulator GSP13 [Virgibacillus sp. MSJ-26]MBU5467217.1 general stress protein 13 [Virgibacillus sp. MSJ-26]
MTDNIEKGQIIQGKVTGIQPYGAFVALNDSVQGLVHISEVTHGYVKDINEYLSIGDEVTVKVLDINEESNKISLSIRATEEAPKKDTKQPAPKPNTQDTNAAGFNTLKDKLEEWIDQSKDRKQTFKN